MLNYTYDVALNLYVYMYVIYCVN